LDARNSIFMECVIFLLPSSPHSIAQATTTTNKQAAIKLGKTSNSKFIGAHESKEQQRRLKALSGHNLVKVGHFTVKFS